MKGSYIKKSYVTGQYYNVNKVEYCVTIKTVCEGKRVLKEAVYKNMGVITG